MSKKDGLLHAYVLDGKGAGKALDWEGVRAWKAEDGVLWLHLDRTRSGAETWVREYSGIDAATANTLLSPRGNRPRVDRIGAALLLILRGINRTPGDEADDMVAMHTWVDEHRIITLRRRRLMAGAEIRDLVEAGHGPRTAAEFLVLLVDRMAEPVAGILGDIDEEVDRLHDEVLGGSGQQLRESLRDVRQSIIALRRYLAPQRDAMTRLLLDKSVKPGDVIAVGTTYGWIASLGARYTSVVTRDGIEHLIPNEELITTRVENWSHSFSRIRLRVPVGVHYNSDVPLAIRLCVEAANAVPRVLTTPPTACLLKGFGDSSVDLEIRIWIDDPQNGCSSVRSEVMLQVWKLFHEHGVEIPYPQRDLHIRSSEGLQGTAMKAPGPVDEAA